MSYIEPSTSLKILSGVPLDPDYENTMYFDNITEQTNYFLAKTIHSFDRMTYQRKGRGVVRVGWVQNALNPNTVISRLYNANYMMFKNENFENKWFYAFVNKVEYINNNTVDVYYSIDVMQTWHFDYTFNQCFIERQHTITDRIGDHTLPEKLETGEYVSTVPEYVQDGQLITDGFFHYTPAVCLVTTFDASGEYCPGKIIHGQYSQGAIFSGLFYSVMLLNATTINSINDTLEHIVTDALADGVVAIFMMPWEFASSITGQSVAPAKTLGFDIRSENPSTHELGYYLGSYRPRNKKLMCYPYNLLYVTNNQGNDAEFRWEDFSNIIAAQFQIWGNVSPNGGLTLMPAGYKGVANRNADELMQLTGFPLCSWTFDSFKAWLAQNAGTITAAGVGLGLQWATIIASGPAGAIASGNMTTGGYLGQHTGYEYNPIQPSNGLIGATLGAVGQLYDHARRPPQARGSGNSSLQYQSGLMTFSFYKKHIKKEYAEIIDNYFDMYGYAINSVGIPNRKARDYYTYVKTIGCSIHGDLPCEDAIAIQNIYNKGIRFWTTAATFGSFDPNVNPNEITIQG
jgi:hypothetical protein